MNHKLGLSTVSAIGQGTWSDNHAIRNYQYDNQDRISALKLGIKLGMTFIDTAEIYGKGQAEKIIAESIKDIDRKDIFITTKVSPQNLYYDNLIRSAENSLIRLNTDYIDLYQIHWANPTIDLEDTFSAMKYLLDAGKIKNIGVCNFDLEELKYAENISKRLNFKLVSNQMEYNLLDNTIDNDIIPYCNDNNIRIIAYSPLKWLSWIIDKNIINNNVSQKRYILENIAKKYDKTISQIILNWIISKNLIVIPNSYNLKHIKENAFASDFNLDKSDIDIINKTFKSNIVYIDIDKIDVDMKEINIDIDKLIPDPKDIARTLFKDTIIKPIKVIRTENRYRLVEGTVKYLSWKYAFEKDPVPIRSLIIR